MRRDSDRLAALASPAFVVALALLVLNDFVFKPLFHNTLTGKLSDFAGLFALTLFVGTLAPSYRRLGGVAIAAAFAFWKTTYAAPLIDSLNAVSPFAFGRTVDLTDWGALPMVPIGVWAAPRLRPSPLPRLVQIGLALLAPVAFTATSLPSHLVRSTMEVPSATAVDQPAVQSLLDELAERHGLRCTVCDPIGDGRVYLHLGRHDGPSSWVVNFDAENRSLFFATSGYGRHGRRDVLALYADVRDELAESLPGVTVTTFEDTHESRVAAQVTTFAIDLPNDDVLPVESAERAKRALSSIVEEVVRSHGLRTDATSLVYYAGRRVGVRADERDFALVPVYADNATLQVEAASRTPRFDELQRAVAADLAQRLTAAFGPAVTRHDGLRESAP